ncbi:MAG TPA: recombinase family protein [Dermatophilaceae bacterium]
MLGAVAGYERNMIALRMRRGRARKAHQGGYAYGAPPFGLQATDRELVEHPVERETTARIVELRETGASLRSIVDTLAAEGRPAKRGGTWHPRTVAAVVRTAQLADRP